MLVASQGLNYQKILTHDSEEIAKLRDSLLGLNIRWDSGSLGDYASKQEARQYSGNTAGEQPSGGVDTRSALDLDTVERQGQIIESLSDEGFSDRSGNVYSSFVKSRSLSFKQVPHRIGLPDFDVVVAPDFAPNPGLHGIFIGSGEVMSMTLSIIDGKTGEQWQIEKQKKYSSEEQMVDFVTLMSAGFELPE